MIVPVPDDLTQPSFAFYRLRFHFQAREKIHFPEGKPGNIVRGAFGTLLRKIACRPDCPGARACPLRRACAYARIFEPAESGVSPSGLANWPRPFVFRARHLNGQTIQPSKPFHFDVHLFNLRDPAISYYIQTFSELAQQGLGPGRGRASLVSVEHLDLQDRPTAVAAPSVLPLLPHATPVHGLSIHFLSPTELKHEDGLAQQPDFPVLFARIRDRVATLTALYGAGPLAIDFPGLGARAAQIRMSSCHIATRDVVRRSSRTGQRHPIGGFTGVAGYEGGLAEFVPYLEAAVYAGVGRQTTFGNGEIRVQL